MLLTLSIVIFLVALAISGGAALWILGRTSAVQPATAGATGSDSDDAPGWVRSLSDLGGVTPVKPPTAGLRQRLFAAGFRRDWAPQAYNGAKTFGMVALPILTLLGIWLLTGDFFVALPAAMLAAYIGYVFPDRYLRRRAETRRAAINSALPDFLDLLVIAIESGLSMDQAMTDASRDLQRAHPELCDELAIFRSELLAGAARSEALRNLGSRVGERELKKLTSLLIQADRFGTSVAKVLRTQTRYMRIRRRQAAEEKAHKVGVKLLFPIFFLIMPAVFLVTAGPAVIMLIENFGRMAGDL